ncbi:MAG TPA: penicillin-binding protein [Bryobacteraceae bacterium]|nr:penicillin-binding protein [Bryobacteraceae bacterium]
MPETQPTRRLHLLLWILLGWAGVISARLVSLQVIHHDELTRLAQQQQQRTKEIPAMRGTIFDRTGQPLAKSIPAESVCINPQRIPDPAMVAELLSRILELDRNKLQQRIESAKFRGSGFLWIKRKILSAEADRLRSLKLSWVEFRPEVRRFYPHHQLAAHVVGSMGMASTEDTLEHGTAGIEASFDDDLAGQPGLAHIFTDVKQNPYDQVVARSPEPGAHITLTIDSNLQYDAEKALARAMERTGAKTGSIVAMNPYTGEILAMANYPTFDPNEVPTANEAEGARSNLAIATPFEPGSVFKTITLSAALETTRIRPDTMINCGNGSINLFGRVIHDHNRYAALSMAQVLEKSSNIGAIQIGLKVGDRGMYQYVHNFGFGRKTGVELPGESAGLVRRVEDWTPSSIGSVAMGHEVSATSIQLAVAGAVIANGGLRVKPQIVLARQKPGETMERFATEKPSKVVAPETAIQMRQMMEGVVLRGTGKGLANLKGYTSGGKTGSAQIYDLKAHVYTHHYNASFVGFAPVANPQIVIAVTLNGTSGGSAGYGGPVAAPVFREIATSALRMLDVPKDLPDDMFRAVVAEPVDRDDLAIAGLGDAPPHGPQAVSSVTPMPPVPADTTSDVSDVSRRLFLNAAVTGPKAPNFVGMTLSAVLEEASVRGLQVETLGAAQTGLVRDQSPPAGASLPPGMRVRVQFAK